MDIYSAKMKRASKAIAFDARFNACPLSLEVDPVEQI